MGGSGHVLVCAWDVGVHMMYFPSCCVMKSCLDDLESYPIISARLWTLKVKYSRINSNVAVWCSPDAQPAKNSLSADVTLEENILGLNQLSVRALPIRTVLLAENTCILSHSLIQFTHRPGGYHKSFVQQLRYRVYVIFVVAGGFVRHRRLQGGSIWSIDVGVCVCMQSLSKTCYFSCPSIRSFRVLTLREAIWVTDTLLQRAAARWRGRLCIYKITWAAPPLGALTEMWNWPSPWKRSAESLMDTMKYLRPIFQRNGPMHYWSDWTHSVGWVQVLRST